MYATLFNHQIGQIQARTRRFTGFSGLVHVLFFTMLYLTRSIAPGPERLVEITWLEPAEIVPAARSTSPPLQKEATRTSSKSNVREHFERELVRAKVAPNPQSADASEDRLEKRLASLQRAAVDRNVQVAGIAPPSQLTKPVLAGMPAERNSAGTPKELTREPSAGTQEPVELARVPMRTSAPAIASIRVPEAQSTPEPAKPSKSPARRSLAGASLIGPVADRPLKSYTTPNYPEWAKREGVEGSSSIYFVVLPDGRIKESLLLEKTSGIEDFDRNAMEALLTWRFEPLRGAGAGEQWGRITFHFRLNSGTAN